VGCGRRLSRKNLKNPEDKPEDDGSWLEPHNQWTEMAKKGGYHIPAPKPPTKSKPGNSAVACGLH
jgi:hypothetical protein